MGVPWDEALQVGALLGKKLVMTEFVAYLDLAQIMSGENPLSQRSAIIASYALCGFANFASLAYRLVGLAALPQSERLDYLQWGFVP